MLQPSGSRQVHFGKIRHRFGWASWEACAMPRKCLFLLADNLAQLVFFARILYFYLIIHEEWTGSSNWTLGMAVAGPFASCCKVLVSFTVHHCLYHQSPTGGSSPASCDWMYAWVKVRVNWRELSCRCNDYEHRNWCMWKWKVKSKPENYWAKMRVWVQVLNFELNLKFSLFLEFAVKDIFFCIAPVGYLVNFCDESFWDNLYWSKESWENTLLNG